MAVQEITQNELVLNQAQYSYVLDRTKGIINCLVGPTKQQISNTDQPIRFNRTSRKFDFCSLPESIQEQVTADEGSYIVLEGTTKDGTPPPVGGNGVAGQVGKVEIGRKIMIPGPISFPLWPGQVATVVPGHHLKTNEYLICRAYNDDELKKNWDKAIMRKRKTVQSPGSGGKDDKPTESKGTPIGQGQPDLVMGQLIIIKGTDVAYFVPPTGIEVMPQTGGGNDYVRSAVTLEKPDYCILLSESGHKRYVQGPDVVFPEPTEGFFTKDGLRKFKAYELNENMGLHIKVIEAYEDNGQSFKEGEEIFITGNEQPIYFPRKEHSVIRYGDADIQYAVAIPAGEGRYVLDKKTGKVDLVMGPKMFLADPRNQVIVRRILNAKECEAYYPGNVEAAAINGALNEQHGYGNTALGQIPGGAMMMLSPTAGMHSHALYSGAVTADALEAFSERSFVPANFVREAAGKAAVADEMRRQQRFTPPRTVTLNTKYDGAVTINIWNGYAVLVVGANGQRRVVKGPTKLLLQYDEILEPQGFSTGKPKTTDNIFRTVYLKYQHNQVTDIITVTTHDLVKVSLKVSYRVNFEGDESNWFAVDNYVKFLCDRMRSMLTNAVKKVGIEQFIALSHDIVRNTVLGEKKEGSPREGKYFTENGMRIYDVELLAATVGTDGSGTSNAGSTDIIAQLTQASHASVTNMIRLKAKESELLTTQREEKIKQDIEFAKQDTQDKILELQARATQKKLLLDQAKQNAIASLENEALDINLNKQGKLDQLQHADLIRASERSSQNLRFEQEQLILTKDRLQADTAAFTAKIGAIPDKLVLALNHLGDKNLATEIAKSMGPVALLRNNSVADAFSQLVHNLPGLGDVVANLKTTGSGIETKRLETASK